MQTVRHYVYLIVAVGSIALAACQPPDRFTETPGSDIAHLADASAQLLNFGGVSIRISEESSMPPRAPSKQ